MMNAETYMIAGLVLAGVSAFLISRIALAQGARIVRDANASAVQMGRGGNAAQMLYDGLATELGDRVAERGLILGAPRFRSRLRQIERNLAHLGQQDRRPSDLLGRALLNSVLAGLGALALQFALAGTVGLLFPLVGLIAGYGFSTVSLTQAARHRLVRISRRIPFALDGVVLMMDAGATFQQAVQSLIEREPDEPLYAELELMLRDIDAGKSFAEALEALSSRLELDDLVAVVTAIRLGDELGTPMSEVLRTQAAEIRQKRTMRAERLAREASNKMALPATLMMLANMLIILGPILVRLASGELFGGGDG